MSYRYPSGFEKPGLNTLVSPSPTGSYTQYGGIWKLNAASAAQGAGTWAVPPAPHLFSWGANGSGQLGLGNTTNYSSPKQIGSLTTWASIGSSNSSTYVVKTDGTIWAWGYGGYGVLGLGNTTNYSSPKQIGALTNWSTVTRAFGVFATARKTDGSLWAWGYDSTGQLGLGNTTDYSSPKQIGALTDWLKFSCGQYHTLSIKTDGSLWSWGSNSDFTGSGTVKGQLGLNTSSGRVLSPTQVGALTNWLKISAGSYFSTAVKTDGTLWVWGENFAGQLGLGNTTNYSSPKQVGSGTDWSSVFNGQYHALAIKTDGTLWAWGQGNYGQLGIGNTSNYSSPKQVGALTNWLSVVGGYAFTVALKTDGTIWGWGRNVYGQLGQGNTTNYSSPKQIGSLATWQSIQSGVNNIIGIATT